MTKVKFVQYNAEPFSNNGLAEGHTFYTMNYPGPVNPDNLAEVAHYVRDNIHSCRQAVKDIAEYMDMTPKEVKEEGSCDEFLYWVVFNSGSDVYTSYGFDGDDEPTLFKNGVNTADGSSMQNVWW